MPRAVVSIPYYRCRAYIRRAVESVLAQTERDIVVVVANDGDPEPPWDLFSDLSDPRLFRFELDKNRGPYFVHEVIRRAAPALYFVPHDADDYSAPNRIERLIAELESTDAIAATSMIGGDYLGMSHLEARRIVGEPKLQHRWCHIGIHRVFELGRLGGYYGGARVGWDSLVMNVTALAGELRPGTRPESIAFVPETLYYRTERQHSLSKAPGTRATQAARDAMQAKYSEILRWRGYRDELPAVAAGVMTADVTTADACALDRAAARLRARLG